MTSSVAIGRDWKEAQHTHDSSISILDGTCLGCIVIWCLMETVAKQKALSGPSGLGGNRSHSKHLADDHLGPRLENEA
jgi:hypothetical protein